MGLRFCCKVVPPSRRTLGVIMLDPESLYLAQAGVLNNEKLRGLPLVISLSHPQDAGGTAGQLAEVLIKELKNVPIVEFDSDQLHDYRARKPRIRFVEDHYENPVMPQLKLYAVEDRLGTPFLLLAGTEPDLQWQRFVQAVVDIAERVDISMALIITAFPMPVPHTRPLPVSAHGNRKDLTRGISAWHPVADLPGSVSSLLEVSLGKAGLGTAGFAINVPQYLAEAELPQASLLAMEHVQMAAKLSLPTDELLDASDAAQVQINEQVAQNPEIGVMISRLEENYDNSVKNLGQKMLSLAERDEGKLPDRDELGATIEAYLAQLDDEGGTDARG